MKNIFKSQSNKGFVWGWGAAGRFFDLNPDGLLCFNALFGLHVMLYLVVVVEIWVCMLANKDA